LNSLQGAGMGRGKSSLQIRNREIMRADEKKKIAEIMGTIYCTKNFQCAASDFSILCKAKDLYLDSYVECLEPNPHQCSFALSARNRYYCNCALRVYLIKKLRK